MVNDSGGGSERLRTIGGPRYRQRSVRNANEIVSEHIRRLVFDGVLKAGDRIPQDEIAESLGLSRLPVREALIGLKHQGVVTLHPHRGAYVNRFDEETVRDHFDLSGHVLAYATRRATERADEDVLASIDELAETIQHEDEPDEVEYLAGQLMRTVTLASGSAHVRLILRTINRIVPGNFFAVIPHSIESIRGAAPQIARAMQQRDAEIAAAIYERYIASHGELVIDYLKTTGVFT
jgi:DNA-binding GntR family transcriptional regulator